MLLFGQNALRLRLQLDKVDICILTHKMDGTGSLLRDMGLARGHVTLVGMVWPRCRVALAWLLGPLLRHLLLNSLGICLLPINFEIAIDGNFLRRCHCDKAFTSRLKSLRLPLAFYFWLLQEHWTALLRYLIIQKDEQLLKGAWIRGSLRLKKRVIEVAVCVKRGRIRVVRAQRLQLMVLLRHDKL